MPVLISIYLECANIRHHMQVVLPDKVGKAVAAKPLRLLNLAMLRFIAYESGFSSARGRMRYFKTVFTNSVCVCAQEWSPEASRSISRKMRGGESEENVVTLTNIVSSGGGDVPPSPITLDTGRLDSSMSAADKLQQSLLMFHYRAGSLIFFYPRTGALLPSVCQRKRDINLSAIVCVCFHYFRGDYIDLHSFPEELT